MRGFSLYLVAGILVVLALDMIAPPVGLGFSIGAWPTVESGSTIQAVDRTHKGDRLRSSTTIGKQPMPAPPPVMLVGCDPAFSPLSASARANFPGRCIA